MMFPRVPSPLERKIFPLGVNTFFVVQEIFYFIRKPENRESMKNAFFWLISGLSGSITFRVK